MSHRHPRRPLRNGTTLDVEDVNENFTEVQSEMAGNLGEHNFEADAIATRAKWADDIAMRLHHVYVESDGSDATSDVNDYDVPQNSQWSAVDDMVLVIDSFGALADCTASFQCMSAELGLMVAIRVDGVVDPDSIWGGAADLDVENRELTLDADYFERSTPGACSRLDAGVCETQVPLSPGRHTVELVARTVGIAKPASDGNYRLYHREMFLLEVDACR